MTLSITLYRNRRHKELGIPAALVRDEDETVDPAARAKIVRNSGARLCVSDHINAGGGTGAEIWVSQYSDQRWANMVAAELRTAGVYVRGIKMRRLPNGEDYYFMHRETGRVETLIVEHGFIDSADAAELVRTWPARAEAVVKGTCKYQGLTYTLPKGADPLADALAVLAAAGKISSPDYWLEVARPGRLAAGEYVALLIQRFAQTVKGGK